MILYELIKNVDFIEIIGDINVEIEDVTISSSQVQKNNLFIALKGVYSDGHDYITQAVNYGATAVVVQKKIECKATQIVVKDSRKAMSIIAGNFYNHADRELKIIGVTGTNGKTSTSYMIYKILQAEGEKAGFIGTIGVFYDKNFIEASLTTPDPLVLHKYFRQMVDSGIEIVIMEVSAHAEYFDKLFGIKFLIGVFTNFTQDHLDFFGDMENYKAYKLKFFKENKCKYAVLNADDKVGLEIAKLCKMPVTYGIDNPSDIFAINIKQRRNGTSFVINLFDCIYTINTKLIGLFNVYNILAVATTCTLLGLKTDIVAEQINNLDIVCGRMEKVYNKDFSVYLDYAHTPDGLEKALVALRPICEGKLMCVFGCGGNRDKSKRKKMGETSAKFADFTVITTDNPRFEDPMDIINEIEKGVVNISNNYVIVQDRKQAIEYALNNARKNDIVLIAGKGSEQYQEVLGIKRVYNDKEIVKSFLRDTL